MSAPGRAAAGAGRGGGRLSKGCLLSFSDTQYKMTISMADWPSEASEVSQWSG